ncbi:hypothetical protein Anas_13657 [Armadillidium nasatum]|uniref:WAP domain-containing protein n=1 Tax=Armadillidium nasatum TaxID=96803 RepID=A0A5N5T7H1_9CRUS|nr:hypothetical protein Anas_13657 [Armadillidium nasatum]
MNLLFLSFSVFFSALLMNVKNVSTIPPIRYDACRLVSQRDCSPNSKPDVSCILKRCPSGSQCCYNGCSFNCYSYLKEIIEGEPAR